MHLDRSVSIVCVTFACCIAAAGPELSLSGDGAEVSSTRGGNELDVVFEAVNGGDITAQDVLVRFVLSDDTELSEDDLLLGETVIANVFAGTSTPRLFRERVPYFIEPGLYSLIGVIDPDDTVAESDETDNVRVFGGLVITEQGSRTVNIDFDMESETYEGPGVLGGPGDQLWNGEVAGFGDLVFFSGFIESDGGYDSEIRVAFPVNGRARTLLPNDLLNDWISGGPFMTQGPYEFLIEGLIPGASYDLVVYSASDAVGPMGGAFTFGGETRSSLGNNQSTFVEGESYVEFRGLVADGQGHLDGLVDDTPIDEDDGYAINGIQIALASFPGACTADLSGDGVLDLADVQAFIDAFVAGEPAADLNGDGVYDLGDVQAFTNGFTAGC